MKLDNNKKFNSLTQLAQGLLTMPYPNALIEEFSQLNL